MSRLTNPPDARRGSLECGVRWAGKATMDLPQDQRGQGLLAGRLCVRGEEGGLPGPLAACWVRGGTLLWDSRRTERIGNQHALSLEVTPSKERPPMETPKLLNLPRVSGHVFTLLVQYPPEHCAPPQQRWQEA